MKSKILSIITTGVIGFAGLVSTASTAPGYKALKPLTLVTQEGAPTYMANLPLCAIGSLQGNFFQVIVLWAESRGNITFSMVSDGELDSMDVQYTMGTISLPTGN
jgi:hypothetical protein